MRRLHSTGHCRQVARTNSRLFHAFTPTSPQTVEVRTYPWMPAGPKSGEVLSALRYLIAPACDMRLDRPLLPSWAPSPRRRYPSLHERRPRYELGEADDRDGAALLRTTNTAASCGNRKRRFAKRGSARRGKRKACGMTRVIHHQILAIRRRRTRVAGTGSRPRTNLGGARVVISMMTATMGQGSRKLPTLGPRMFSWSTPRMTRRARPPPARQNLF